MRGQYHKDPIPVLSVTHTGTKLQRSFEIEATIEVSRAATRDGIAWNSMKFKSSPSTLKKLGIMVPTIGSSQELRGTSTAEINGLSFLWVRELTKRFLI
jgi:hypothetical protein